MIALIAVISGGFLFFYFVLQGERKITKPHSLEADSFITKMPKADWTFKKEIGPANVPEIICTYRKNLNGYNFDRIKKSINRFKNNENKLEKNQSIIRIIEPLLELSNGGYLTDYKVNNALTDAYIYLTEYYPITGDLEQLNKLKEISVFFPESAIGDFDFKQPFIEIIARNEIVDIMDKNGGIYKNDLNKLDSFKNLKHKKSFVHRMKTYKALMEEKDGKFTVYKTK